MSAGELSMACGPAGGPARPGWPAARRIAGARGQERITVTGTISAAAAIGVGSSRAYRCTLADGTGELDLLFLGRTAIAGLTTGARCRAHGMATRRSGRLVIWNPRYQLDPPGEAGKPCPREPQQPRAPVVAAVPAGTSIKDATDVTDIAGSVEAAGHFRIYLGAAAGVGKTTAMLDEGHRRRRRGADVVIAVVECHGRPMTEARIAGLETVSRRSVEYRGTTFAEMDLDAVLGRRPKVALVDELAHTNLPGSGRHGKRWQDVLELLDTGIDVVTTVNIQHLESIADAVEQITGVPVRERVPDWVVRRADQIELIDSSPEQLRRRMLHGNIYPAEQIPQALTHFFSAGNLTALRELALRFLADETEEELLEYLQRHHSEVPWETTERIMAGVTAAPGTEAIVRRASRMAARIKADLDIVHITSGGSAAEKRDDRLAPLRQVVSDVGASWHQLEADDPAGALIEFARDRQITQIVVGSSQRSRWQELISGGSIVRRVSRLATRAGIDVHIVARREVTAP